MNAFLRTRLFSALALGAAALSATAADPTVHRFHKLQLGDQFWSEGASFGDFNRDGKMDIVAGPYWWEGPDFKVRHEIYPATQTFKVKKDDGTEATIPGFEGGLGTKNTYSDNFFAFVYDFNGDGWPDVLVLGFPGKDASWYENPKGQPGHWTRHKVFDVVDNESPTWADVTGDGKPEIICNSGGYFGYVTPDWSDTTKPWTFHPISPKGNWQRFTHGLGVGDVNGDGRTDILDSNGWWEQPASLAGDPVWKRHDFPFAPGGGAQLYVYDVNGDGRPDVITSLAAHGYGLAWYEQLAERDAKGEIQFRQHMIMNKEASENAYGVHFSQLHALELVDVDGDGLKDIVTGKRFWAHGNHGDPEPEAPALLYWFKLVRKGNDVQFVPHLIDDNSGVGTQVVVGDVNGDGLPDVVVGNKKGVFVHLQSVDKVSAKEAQDAEPKVLYPDAGKVSAIAPAPAPVAAPASSAAAAGILPVGRDGKPLNTDFETGDLRDWTATGDAFGGQPYKGPINQSRQFGQGRVAHHRGEYWIGGYEVLQDKPQGTLTSAPFKVTQPYASFLLGGGSHPGTRVELVRADTQEVFFRASGRNDEAMLPVVVDLQSVKDKEIFIRIVDEVSGGWGHVNFDDFKLYAQKPVFADAVTLAADLPPADDIKFAGLPPDRAAQEMILPPGFKAQVFASEPDIKNPISFCLDDRGRLWVAQGMTYPQRAPEGQGQDSILVFEDTNGDGKFDKRTVFMEGLNLVSGLEVGFGGVWVGAAPYLYYIPIADGDTPKPAGPPQTMLEGWAYQDTHETLNTFKWGPDGWLYGCHGVFTHSHVKRPGEPDSTRQFINAGVWRFHPTKHTFEVFAEGTSNPWGVDFDAHGQCIIEACVIPHLWHMIQGARYQRQGGQHYAPSLEEEARVAPGYLTQDFGKKGLQQPLQPYIYDDIKTIADHVHYAGKTPHGGNGRSASAGGGHAHAGLMVYLGGSWPDKYVGQYFMNNIHGARINMDMPERAGSGFVGHHGPDFINFNDKASQILNLLYDQDGSVYMIDWYDLNQCHRTDRAAHDYDTGRIFKIVYGDTKTTSVDLQKASDEQLVTYLGDKHEWYARHAQRILEERGANPKVHALLTAPAANLSPETELHRLWTLHATGGLTEPYALEKLQSPNEYTRAWTIQLLCENKKPSATALKKFAEMAKSDKSPVVRLYLASALQRLPLGQRGNILTALITHEEDINDHNLPLMYWYAAEPVVGSDTTKAIELLSTTKIPVLREFISRRLAAATVADNK